MVLGQIVQFCFQLGYRKAATQGAKRVVSQRMELDPLTLS